MNQDRTSRDPSAAGEGQRRARPKGMPLNAPPARSDALKGVQKPTDVLPRQRSLTDEEELPRKPARWKTILLKTLSALLLLVALALGYVFLLLGEPDEDTAYTRQVEEERIAMPMSAVESPGESNPAALAEIFGQPVLNLYGSALQMERSRVYDTAFGGGYARRVTLTYRFEDGAALLVEGVRPTAAVTLLGGSGYSLDADSLYYIGGVDAARMENGSAICVFGQTDAAAYAVLCPKAHAGELETLLKQTALTAADRNE